MNELKEAFLRKYPKYEVVLRMFEEANGCTCTFTNLTKIRLQKFVDYMGTKLAQSSVRQYCAKFKAVLNLYNEEVELPKGYEKILSVKNEKSSNIWLTDEELERISKYQSRNEQERRILAQFLVAAYTGARHSDAVIFDRTNIVNGNIEYVSQKTKTFASIPLKPIVAELLKRGLKCEVSDPTYNETIRRICLDCGITQVVKVFKAGRHETGEKWKFVSSHTARRSFATNLYLRGADLYSISKLMGHSSVVMTEGYISCGLRKLSDEVMNYFK